MSIVYLIARRTISIRTGRRIYPIDRVPPRDAAMVLGAGVYPDGRLSAILVDRLDTGIRLLEAGKVQTLLMTADDKPEHQRQTTAMADYALRRGVPADSLVLDRAGSRTYASCYRARHVFDLSSVIVVTQRFHLDRALYLCERVGLDAVGVEADRRTYASMPFWLAREQVAWVAAWRDGLLQPEV